MAPQGGVGGNVNIVTKRAEDDPLTRVAIDYFSNTTFSLVTDVRRRFGDNKEYGIRVNGTFTDGDTPIDPGNGCGTAPSSPGLRLSRREAARVGGRALPERLHGRAPHAATPRLPASRFRRRPTRASPRAILRLCPSAEHDGHRAFRVRYLLDHDGVCGVRREPLQLRQAGGAGRHDPELCRRRMVDLDLPGRPVEQPHRRSGPPYQVRHRPDQPSGRACRRACCASSSGWARPTTPPI